MMKKRNLSFIADPLWYKDAVIYQLHVKSFFDSNNDRIGDFSGLLQKLDYIASLGVNAIWFLPFYPSPGQAYVLEGFAKDPSQAFLAAYRADHAESRRQWVTEADEPTLLDLFLLEKAGYEICYEAASGPSWLGIPVRGLARIAQRVIALAEAP
jgi:predicted trehalose synthase